MWQIYPCRTAISQILIPILTAAYLTDQVWQIYPHPIEWQFHRFWFLFWQLIFGRPGVADLTSPHVELAISQILIPTSDSSYLADQVWLIYPHPIEWQFHRFWFLFWQLHIWVTRCGRSTPVEQQFHRFWFLLWQLIFGLPGVADLPPPHRMAISQILIPILTAHIWQTRCGRSTPVEQQFHRFWFLFCQLIFGRLGVADLPPPHRMAISQILIPILIAHIWLTRCGRSTPCRTAISQILIPILTAHIWSYQVWQIYPHLIEWAISQILIPILTAAYLADQVWQIYPM